MASAGIEQLLARGRAAVSSARHDVERDPAESGRWGASALFLPSGALATSLANLTDEVMAILGDGHWASGGAGRVHVTVRALEPYAETVAPDRVTRYLAAMAHAMVEPVRLEFTGLGLSPNGVIACASSVDGRADQLRRRLEDELGDDGWLERAAYENGRDPIWYSTLVHFGAHIADPNELVRWVDQRAHLALGGAEFDSLELCTWSFDGRAMAPDVIGSASLGA
jgi:hypothetical protein